jgi:hypothetical protein
MTPLPILAAAHGGVLLVSHAKAAGWNRNTLDGRLRHDGWTPIHRGAWAPPGRAVGTELRVRAIQLAHPELVASYRSAAVLHQIELRAEAVELTGPGDRRPTMHGALLHRVPLARGEVVTMDGLRVTTVPRTLADLLRSLPRDEALVAVESALTRRPCPGAPWVPRPPLVCLDDIAGVLAAAPNREGTAQARQHLAQASTLSGSPPETIARLAMHDAGLYPEQQVRLIAPSGRRMYPDFLFRAERLVVEIEGYAWHGSRQAHEDDTRRFNELGACPEVRRVLRFTALDVYRRSGWMVNSIRREL